MILVALPKFCTAAMLASYIGFYPQAGIDYAIPRSQWKQHIVRYTSEEIAWARSCAAKLKIKYHIAKDP